MKPTGNHAFSLIELMMAMVLVAVLGGIATFGYGAVREKTDRTLCLAKINHLARGILLYAQDHNGKLPKSSHSGGTPHWAAAAAPYIGEEEGLSRDEYRGREPFRCPAAERLPDHDTRWHYAYNVFLELSSEVRYTPSGRVIRPESYVGSPQMWQRMVNIERPSRTVLLAETHEGVDHFMAHHWRQTLYATTALGKDFHAGPSHVAFADGHVEFITPDQTLDSAQGLNLWNPSLAR